MGLVTPWFRYIPFSTDYWYWCGYRYDSLPHEGSHSFCVGWKVLNTRLRLFHGGSFYSAEYVPAARLVCTSFICTYVYPWQVDYYTWHSNVKEASFQKSLPKYDKCFVILTSTSAFIFRLCVDCICIHTVDTTSGGYRKVSD